jgi:hypothetical protein
LALVPTVLLLPLRTRERMEVKTATSQ